MIDSKQTRMMLENNIIGSVLLDNLQFTKVADYVTNKSFSNDIWRQSFNVMERYAEQGAKIDSITISEAIKHINGCENAFYELSKTMKETVCATNAQSYAKLLHEHIQRLDFALSLKKAQQLLESSDNGLAEILEFTNNEIQTVVSQAHKKEEWFTLTDVLIGLVNEVDLMMDGNLPPKLDTGFPQLDKILQGMRPGNLVVLAARPSSGKTTFALNIAANVMLNAKKHVGLFSFEMSETEIMKSLFANIAGVPLKRLKGEDLNDMEWPRFSYGVAQLQHCNMRIYTTGSSITHVKKAVKDYCKTDPECGLIIIDYIQLMTKKGAENRVMEISAITRELKLLAKEMAIPIIALSQLNRNKDSRADKSPVLSDLRDSGSIEQDADVVMFVEKGEEGSKIVVGKNRSGPIGEAKFKFLGEVAKFVEMEISNEYQRN